MSNEPEPEPGRDALRYEASRVSWAVADTVAMPPATLARTATYMTVFLIVSTVVFAQCTSIWMTVEGVGAIRTSAKAIPVRTEAGGRIAVLSVKDGQVVKKGQVLVELEDQVGAETLDNARGLIKRLDALVKDDQSNAAMTEAGAIAQELMQLDIPSMVRERSSLAEAANGLSQSLRGVQDVPELSAADAAERAEAQAKIARIRRQGLASELTNELSDLQRTATRLAVSMSSRRDQAHQQLTSARSGLAVQIRSFEQALALHIRSQRVLAPSDGIANKLAVSGPAELVPAGQTLLEIIPDGGSLTAEVVIANRDIAQLKVGMPVELRIDALPHHDYGTLPAHIAEIPPDATAGQQGGSPTYLVRLSLDRTTLDAGQGPRPVSLGMTLQAEVQIRRRTLLRLALNEILQLKDKI
jgi:multidrug efflux pump subunit AcrA (membrane-fusion protein)